MKTLIKPYLVTNSFTPVFGHVDSFYTKDEAIKFALEKGNKSVWFKPSGQRKICQHDKAKKVF
jgi:hypothetical protein